MQTAPEVIALFHHQIIVPGSSLEVLLIDNKSFIMSAPSITADESFWKLFAERFRLLRI